MDDRRQELPRLVGDPPGRKLLGSGKQFALAGCEVPAGERRADDVNLVHVSSVRGTADDSPRPSDYRATIST